MTGTRPIGVWERRGGPRYGFRGRVLLASRLLLAGLALAAPAPLLAEDPPVRPSRPPDTTTVPALEVPAPRVRPVVSPLQSGYVEALRVLASGDRPRALEAVITLEVGEASGAPARDAERIERAGRALARRMAEVDGESLVPVMVLRQELMREYHRRGHAVLSLVAGNLALANAGLYAEVRPDATAQGLAGGLVASVAGGLQAEGSLQTARLLFERALVLAPASEAALLGLGAHFELLGRYDLAAAHYSRAHTAHPEDVEGALRLGVNLVRLKRYGHAIPILRDCAGREGPDWIAVVATEELARALVASGKLAEAQVVLQRCIERFPDETSLRVQLAFVLDLSRDPVAARLAIEEIGAGDPAAAPSARLRYCRWPRQALDAVRAELELAARERERVLAAVVSALAARGA